MSKLNRQHLGEKRPSGRTFEAAVDSDRTPNDQKWMWRRVTPRSSKRTAHDETRIRAAEQKRLRRSR